MRIERLLLACAIALAAAAPAGAQPRLGLHVTPCSLGKSHMPARCGSFGVYENRAAKSGRVIGLHVIVVPAVHPSHRAIAVIVGGPGQAATDVAPLLADGVLGPARTQLHDRYDFVFMDDRGTGKSNAFRCNAVPANDPAVYMRYLFPPSLVAACRKTSAATHEVSKYNTNNAVDDLNDLRAALGYHKIVLDGGSYGTFFSFIFMRRHPDRVESAVMDGPLPPHFQSLPGEPMGAQKALDDLVVKCRRDVRCNAAFPKFREHFYAVVKRFDSGTLQVPVKNFATKRTQTVALSKEVFVDTLRHVLYSPYGAAYVPYVIERAYRKDYAPLGGMMQQVVLQFWDPTTPGSLNWGAFLAYSCSDMTPFISQSQVNSDAKHSFAGDLRIEAERQACRILNVPHMPASFNDPVRSNVPVLMILGTDDPATPVKYGLEALRYLPNGKAVLVQGGGHGADTKCTDALVLKFVRAASAKGLDVSKCAATLQLPPFATSMK